MTALHAAAMMGHAEALEALLLAVPKAPASAAAELVNARTSGALLTPLMLAARGGHLSCVRALLRSLSPGDAAAAARAQDRSGNTALMLAARFARCPECTRELLPLTFPSIRPDQELDDSDRTPLHYAARAGRADVIAALLLLTRHLPHEVDAMSNDPMTPLQAAVDAALSGHPEHRAAAFLLQAGADPFQMDPRGVCLFHRMPQWYCDKDERDGRGPGMDTLQEMLLTFTAGPEDICAEEGDTSLVATAIESERPAVAALLLALGMPMPLAGEYDRGRKRYVYPWEDDGRRGRGGGASDRRKKSSLLPQGAEPVPGLFAEAAALAERHVAHLRDGVPAAVEAMRARLLQAAAAYGSDGGDPFLLADIATTFLSPVTRPGEAWFDQDPATRPLRYSAVLVDRAARSVFERKVQEAAITEALRRSVVALEAWRAAAASERQQQQQAEGEEGGGALAAPGGAGAAPPSSSSRGKRGGAGNKKRRAEARRHPAPPRRAATAAEKLAYGALRCLAKWESLVYDLNLPKSFKWFDHEQLRASKLQRQLRRAEDTLGRLRRAAAQPEGRRRLEAPPPAPEYDEEEDWVDDAEVAALFGDDDDDEDEDDFFDDEFSD